MSHSNVKLSQLLSELKQEYIASLPEKIERLRKHTQAQDWTKLSEEYHKLKGNGKTYGLPEISILCEQMEMIALKKDSQDSPTFTPTLFEHALTLLERMHKSYLSGDSFDLDKDPIAKSILSLKVK
jgi:HPt (histidine-containing phosphotransfer) domain-containing protein